MKRAVFCMGMTAALLLSAIGAPAAGPAEQEPGTEYPLLTLEAGMQLVAETQALQLYVDGETAEFMVMRVEDGAKWYSNPPDREEAAQGESLDRLGSLLRVEYLNGNGELLSMDSRKFAVESGGFALRKLDGGVRFEFDLQKTAVTREMLPQIVEKERFETKILSGLEETDAKALTKRYRLFRQGESSEGYTWEQILEKYPSVAHGDRYILSESTPSFDLPKLYQIIFDKTSYTQEDMEKDNRDNGIDAAVSEREGFHIPLEIRLDGDRLTVRIPCGEITSARDFPPVNLYVLENFGAAGGTDEGYMLLPDGSGALMELSQSTQLTSAVRVGIYGPDGAISSTQLLQDTQQAVLPVFGLKRAQGGFVSLITQGDAHAFVTAQTAGSGMPYNRISAGFTVTPYDSMVVQGSKEKIVTYRMQEEPYAGDIGIEYTFLAAEAAYYSAQAQAVRTRLLESGALGTAAAEEPALFVDLIGAVKNQKSVLGIPVTALEELTTFEEAGNIVSQLGKRGVERPVIRYTGWRDGGLKPSSLKTLRVNGCLGGKSGLTGLLDTIRTQHAALYLDAPVQTIYGSGLRFNKWSSAVRYTYQEIAHQYPAQIARNSPDKESSPWQLLSPLEISPYVETYLSKLSRLADAGDAGISLPDMGYMLNSDFHRNKSVDRQTALELQRQTLETAASARRVAVEKGNLYALAHASYVVDLPLRSSGYCNTARSVPFTALVLHGSVNYTGAAVNLSGDPRRTMLQAVECGASLRYCWAAADNTELLRLESEELDGLYSLSYGDWLEEAAAFFRRMEEALSGVGSAYMISHRYLAPDVTETTYANGVQVLVNYGRQAYELEDMVVPAEDFAVRKEERP